MRKDIEEPLEDLFVFMKALGISKDDAIGIALLMKGRPTETDELNQFLVEIIESKQKIDSGEILTRAMELVSKYRN